MDQFENGTVADIEKQSYFERLRLWYSRKIEERNLPGFQNQVVLSNWFWRELQAHPIPVDLDVVRGLADSPGARNGTTSKTVKGEFGEIVMETPRDRNGSFEPQILGKHQTRFEGFDDKILSMYARGMTTREIQGHLQEMYGVEVSATLISDVTDAVLEEVKAWQNRPLEPIYAVVYLDALYVKMRHEGRVENRAVYVAIGIDLEGRKDVLGLWTSSNEGAKFWLGC